MERKEPGNLYIIGPYILVICYSNLIVQQGYLEVRKDICRAQIDRYSAQELKNCRKCLVYLPFFLNLNFSSSSLSLSESCTAKVLCFLAGPPSAWLAAGRFLLTA